MFFVHLLAKHNKTIQLLRLLKNIYLKAIDSQYIANSFKKRSAAFEIHGTGGPWALDTSNSFFQPQILFAVAASASHQSTIKAFLGTFSVSLRKPPDRRTLLEIFQFLSVRHRSSVAQWFLLFSLRFRSGNRDLPLCNRTPTIYTTVHVSIC